jgi:hypothetical protein
MEAGTSAARLQQRILFQPMSGNARELVCFLFSIFALATAGQGSQIIRILDRCHLK